MYPPQQHATPPPPPPPPPPNPCFSQRLDLPAYLPPVGLCELLSAFLGSKGRKHAQGILLRRTAFMFYNTLNLLRSIHRWKVFLRAVIKRWEQSIFPLVPFENVELAAGSVQSEVQPFLQESNPAIANPIKVFLHRFCRNMKGFGLERPGLQDKDCSKSYLSLCIGEGKIPFQNWIPFWKYYYFAVFDI